MPSIRVADVSFASGHVQDCAQLIDYLQSTSDGEDALEPPRKKQRRNSMPLPPSDTTVPTDAVLLAAEEIQVHFAANAVGHNTFTHLPTSVCLDIAKVSQLADGRLSLVVTPPRKKVNGAEDVTLLLDLHSSSLATIDLLRDVADLPSPLATKNSAVWKICTLSSLSSIHYTYTLKAQILCATERTWSSGRQQSQADNLVRKYLPSLDKSIESRWSPQDFYENVHVPSIISQTPSALDSLGLTCQLYPFQKRAVRWMIEREGTELSDDSSARQIHKPVPKESLPPSFRLAHDASGRTCYVSQVHKVIVMDKSALVHYEPQLNGGLLAEEMGLGKTVELIALINFHKQGLHLKKYKEGVLVHSPATLIIAPSHILEQWISEINVHAPHLNALHYKGLSGPRAVGSSGLSSNNRDYTVEDLLEYDIVLTTYAVLSREIHFAETPPDRSMRHPQQYVRRRSPLVLTKWWRVCLDEAQSIESGVSQAATVARMIPRVNAWAISGTPLRKNIADLHGLLIFLGYEPFASSKKAWQSIDKATLKTIVGEIALRHNKHKISHELKLPPQCRVAISLPFTAIEDQNYDHLFAQMHQGLGLNADGSPAIDDWDPERFVAPMRQWLRRLRETCLHPHVGSQNRRTLGRGQGPPKTVYEVLELMIEHNQTDLRAQERALILTQVLGGQITNNDKSNARRSEEALQVYLNALGKATSIVNDCRREHDLEEEKVFRLKAAQPSLQGTNLTVSERKLFDSSEEKISVYSKRVAVLKTYLRSALEALHVCAFYVATAYFQMKEVEHVSVNLENTGRYVELERLETEFYDLAKKTRRELLRPARDEAMETIAILREKDSMPRSSHTLDLETGGGIENRKILDRMHHVRTIMDSQADLIKEWRTKIMAILCGPLVDAEGDKEITGEEYEESTKLQDELYVYIAGLKTVVADRHHCVSGQVNLLINNEMKGYVKQAKDEDKRLRAQAPDLLLAIAEQRSKCQLAETEMSLQAIMSDARDTVARLRNPGQGREPSARAAAEVAIIEGQISAIREMLKTERESIDSLEKEQNLFHKGMNQRLEYYRQLQSISDMVAPWKAELDESVDLQALGKQRQAEAERMDRLATVKTKRRFLTHLRSESTQQEDSRTCVICTDPIETGVLTVCGHQYCKTCILAWWRSHRTCPECRRVLTMNDVHNITYKKQQIRAQKEENGISSDRMESPSSSQSGISEVTSSSHASRAASIYSAMNADTIAEIKAIELDGSYGTKIDTICRHLLWLREHDPGAKSIIFSQFSDFLEALSAALKQFKISSVSIRDTRGVEKFRRDPTIEVFLLDAKSDSSGLNLVNATHVFLCEPLVNVAIELQAIARVHRIGQLRETTVYAYIIQDTVEEAIYEISVGRRLAHMSKSSTRSATASGRASRAQTPSGLGEDALDKANNLEIQLAPIGTLLAKGQNEGELVDGEDLWNCLFGKPRLAGASVSDALQSEVDRQLRVDAAEAR